MGILDKVKSDLEYKAGSTIVSSIEEGVKKVFQKGEKPPVCPKCKKPIEKGLRFCPNCGTKLIVTCPKCNVDYPIGTKFCPQCGEALK